jgi:D-sedoheptulose 7-phosphate isomerase
MYPIIDTLKLMVNSSNKSSHVEQYLEETGKICREIDKNKINELIEALIQLRIREGRLFFIGMGGSAANASHMVNDFRKLANIESYSISDNVSELTARANDEGLDTIFSEWLKVSKLNEKDALFICSVGGGAKGVSESIIKAINYAKTTKTQVFGITGRKQGYLNKKGDIVILIPNVNQKHVTPHTEAFQMIISHAITSHIHVQFHSTKW